MADYATILDKDANDPSEYRCVKVASSVEALRSDTVWGDAGYATTRSRPQWTATRVEGVTVTQAVSNAKLPAAIYRMDCS